MKRPPLESTTSHPRRLAHASPRSFRWVELAALAAFAVVGTMLVTRLALDGAGHGVTIVLALTRHDFVETNASSMLVALPATRRTCAKPSCDSDATTGASRDRRASRPRPPRLKGRRSLGRHESS